MSLILTDSQKVVLAVKPVSLAGNVAAVENVSWSSSDETIVTVVVSASSNLDAEVITTGKVGVAQIRFGCDAKVGEGEVPLLATLDVEVVSGQAVNVQINASSPTEK